jgi:hypothetical protein
MTTTSCFTFYPSGNTESSRETTWHRYHPDMILQIDIICYYTDEVNKTMYHKEFIHFVMEFEKDQIKTLKHHATRRSYTDDDCYCEVETFEQLFDGILVEETHSFKLDECEYTQKLEYYKSGRLSKFLETFKEDDKVVTTAEETYEDV